MESQAMDILKEEMENDELHHRVNAIHRIKLIATILGPEGTKNQLIPYLENLMKKEEDEVLFAIAEELYNLASILGNNQTILIPHLETLASQEETVVRERAIKSLINLSANLNENDIQNLYVPLILRLAANDTNFTCRVSAVNLIVPIYQRAGQFRTKIRQKFTELCGEETPMVRRAVAQKIGDLALVIEKEFVLSELIASVKQLISDEQDQVRVLGLKSLRLVAKVLNKDENKQHTLPIIIAATEDKSWRVRLALSKIFAELAEAFGKEVADVSLIQIFTNLLRDAENDVRSASIISLAKFIKIVSPEKLVIIVPHLQYLAKDSVANVRAGTTDVIGIMCSLVTKDISQTKLLPHILEMFNDDNKEVREGVNRAAARFCEACGADVFPQLVPLFKKSIDDPKWRVRSEAYKSMMAIASKFHNPQLFQNQIEPLLMNFIKDRVAEVRENVIENLDGLIVTHRNDWVFPRLLEKLASFLGKDKDNKENTFLIRSAVIKTYACIARNVTVDQAQQQILPLIYKHLQDSVPNIRFITLKQLFEISRKLEQSSIRSEMKQQISQLLNDNDRDVKGTAAEILSQL